MAMQQWWTLSYYSISTDQVALAKDMHLRLYMRLWGFFFFLFDLFIYYCAFLLNIPKSQPSYNVLKFLSISSGTETISGSNYLYSILVYENTVMYVPFSQSNERGELSSWVQ